MRNAISVFRLGRSFLHGPLAVLLLSLLPPMLPSFPDGSGLPRFEASAQFTNNRIVQNCLGPICADLIQLEDDAVKTYLDFSLIPHEDAHVVYDYGRADLRSEVRGYMFSLLLRIIALPPSSRTLHEQRLYDWLQGLVQQNEIAQYTVAYNEFLKWQSQPCLFTLDADIASQYGMSYDGTPFCFGSPSDLFGGPPVPAEGYFTAYGLKYSYGSPALTHPNFASLVANTSDASSRVLRAMTIGVGAVVAAGGVAVLAYSGTMLAAGTLSLIWSMGGFGAGGAIGSAGTLALSVGTVLGPAAILLIAVLIGLQGGVQAFTNQQTIDNLNNLRDKVTQVTNTPPDLKAFATDPVGRAKLQMTFVAQTVPDVPSAATLPAHADADPNFAIQESTATSPTVTDTLTYRDWSGNAWSAHTSGGWLVQTCSGASCPQPDSIGATIRYVDWAGANWTALRVGDKFLGNKDRPAPTDSPTCTFDSATADVGAEPDFSGCSDYVSTTIPLQDATGALVTASLSVLTPPVFAALPSLPFTPSVSSTQTIAASGNPTPTICYVGSKPALPADFSMNGVPLGPTACANGAFPLKFNGNPGSRKKTYQLTLAASNGTTPTPVSNTFEIDVSPHLMITSPGRIEGTAAVPVNFTVTTTGSPTPKLTADPRLLSLMPGITFTDNGNGTGTFSGSTGFPVQGAFCIPGCGITASSSQGTVVQPFTVNIVAAPAAFLGPQSSATFIAGISNSILLTSVGASTPVSWIFGAFGSAPPWLSLTDNGDGTATLTGIPPLNATGTFNPVLGPAATGTIPQLHAFPVEVVSTPVFVSGNSATFTVGTQGSFVARTNLGALGLAGTLPNGLSFYPSGALQCLLVNVNGACIAGTPALGTGGQQTVILTDDGGALGSTSQSLTLKIYEAPKIGSSDTAYFLVGAPGSFAVTATGYPSLSTAPVPANPTPPTGPDVGTGMYFTVTGLPPNFHASNLNPQGFATGTLTIEGTPSASDIGVYQVQITAQNGVGATAQQTLKLEITYSLPTTTLPTTSTLTTTTAIGATSTTSSTTVTTTTAIGATSTTSSTGVTPTTLPACTSARCLIDAAKASGACTGQRIPTRVLRKFDRAAGLIEQATTNGFKKSLVRKTKKSLRAAKKRATKAAKGKRPKLSGECAAALREVADRVLAGLQT